MLCVDNFSSRKMVQDVCLRMQTVTILSGGNELTDGNVQVFVKSRGRQYTPSLYDYHPEIAEADDHPNSMSCAEAAQSNEQIIFTNLTVATLMLNEFHGLRSRTRPRHAEVYFDIDQNAVVPVESTPM